MLTPNTTNTIEPPDSTLDGGVVDGEKSTTLAGPVEAHSEQVATSSKPISFYLAFLALNISVFVVSLDATALAVAIPVCYSHNPFSQYLR